MLKLATLCSIFGNCWHLAKVRTWRQNKATTDLEKENEAIIHNETQDILLCSQPACNLATMAGAVENAEGISGVHDGSELTCRGDGGRTMVLPCKGDVVRCV